MGELWNKGRWLLLAAAVVAGVSFGWARLKGDALPVDPLALAPAGASVVARVDVPAVTGSQLWRAFLEEDERGVRRIETTCGYDPLAQVERVVVFAFGAEERPFEHLGFVARGSMARGDENRRRLVRCVESVLSEQGGAAIERVRVEGVDAVASAGARSRDRRDDPARWRLSRSHAAFLGEDAVVGGDHAVLEQTIRRVRGDAPPMDDPELRRLWERVSGDRDVVAVGRLPRRWLPALRRMAAGVEGDLEALAALRAIGVGLTVRRGLSLGLAAVTESAADARRLESAVRQQIDAALADPLARLSPLGGALRRVNVEAQGRELVLTVSLGDDRVEQLIELWRELRRQRREAEADEDADTSPGAAEQPAPDPAGQAAGAELGDAERSERDPAAGADEGADAEREPFPR